MSKRVIDLLNRYGPMLSGELARKFEQAYHVSNTAARQALSRARSPVQKICSLSFDKNQKFFYLERQFMSERYMDGLLNAIKSASQVNWAYICAFQAQNGFAAKNILPALVSSPIQKVKGHKLHQRVLEDLSGCRIIEEYNETYWKLADWLSLPDQSIARAAGLEAVKKQIVHDFASWAENINMIGYNSAKTLDETAEFAHFQWALTAPAYIQPLYDHEKERPGFILADIFYGRAATVEDIKFFLDKLSIIRAFKKLPAFLPVFLVEKIDPEALMLLKENKVMVALIKNIFDQKYTELLAEIVRVFSNSSAIIAKDPTKVEELFREISRAEGRFNDMIGDMFELLAGYYYQHIGCRYLQIRKLIQIPNSNDKNEIDVLVERDGEIIIVECKATRSALGEAFVEKWLNQTIPRIRSWVLERYPDHKKVRFQLWSLGGFTQEAGSMLSSAAGSIRKYEVEFFDKTQIIDMAKKHGVQPVVDVLHQHFQPPLEKAIEKNQNK